MSIKTLENYINGEYIHSSTKDYLEVYNPGTGEIIGRVPISTKKDVELAVKAAKEASSGWAATPITKRIEKLYDLANRIVDKKDKLICALVSDGGKTISDAEAEIERVLQATRSAANIEDYFGRCVKGNVNTSSFVRPIGVHASINPYNFPLMVPFWSLPYAIASGNTSIVKASEQAPFALDYISSLLSEIELPPGVVNIIQGNRKTGHHLITHKDVNAISFVGSTKIGQIIYKTASNKLKRVQALCSAKNTALVSGSGVDRQDMDLFLDNIIKGVISAAYGASGQRCAAISNLLIGKELYDNLVDKLTEKAKNIKIGYGLIKDTEMGPVISKKHLKNLHKFIENAEKEGGKIHLDGRNVKVDKEYKNGYYLGPTILTKITSEMSAFHTEAFGPILNVIPVESFKEGIIAINKIKYGNIAVLYSINNNEKDIFENNVNAGMIGINVPIPAAWAPFSFGGKPGTDSLYGYANQGQDAIKFLTYSQLVMENPNILAKSAEKFHQK